MIDVSQINKESLLFIMKFSYENLKEEKSYDSEKVRTISINIFFE